LIEAEANFYIGILKGGPEDKPEDFCEPEYKSEGEKRNKTTELLKNLEQAINDNDNSKIQALKEALIERQEEFSK
jgi:hypothetical protein